MTELPFVRREDILERYQPLREIPSRSAFRTLRSNGFVSAGISITRQARGGKLRGKLQVYCALNQDAVVLARHNQPAEAKRLARRAHAIERSSAAKLLMGALQKQSLVLTEGVTDARLLLGALNAVSADPNVADAMRTITAEISTLRLSSSILQEFQERWLARVSRILLEQVELTFPNDVRFTLPLEDLSRIGVGSIGAAVSVILERSANGRLVKPEPALELAASDLPRRFPFLARPGMPSAAALSQMRAAFAAGPSMSRDLRPVPS